MEGELPKLIFRADNLPEIAHINNTCKISLLKKLKDALPTDYDVVKKDTIFNHILAIYDNDLNYSGRTVHSMMCRQLISKRKHQLWFVFGGKPLRFSLQEFHAVTGLDCRDELVTIQKPELDKDSGFWSRLLKKNRAISIRDILTKHAKTWKPVEMIKMIYICVIAGLIMAKDEKTEIPHAYIHLAMDLDQLRSYPWGRESFDHLIKSINKARENLRSPRSYVMNGFRMHSRSG